MLYCDDCGSITDKNHGAETGGTRCPRCAGATEEAPATSGLSLLDEPFTADPVKNTAVGIGELDLYSSETIAQKRQRKTPTGETKLHLVSEEDDQFTPEPAPAFESVAPSQELTLTETGSQEPFAPRWRFECLACSGTLSVQPVTTRSKVGCPRCQTKMVVSPDGEVSLPSILAATPAPTGTPTAVFSSASTATDALPGFEENDPFFSTTDFSTSDFSTSEETAPSTVASDPLESAVSAPSMAALEAAGEPHSSEGEVMTMAPVRDTEVDRENSITEAPELPLQYQPQLGVETSLGFLDDVTAAGELFDPSDEVESAQETLAETTLARGSTLQPVTVMLWSGLFALPSLAALLVTHAPKDSALWSAMTQARITFQLRCGEWLDQMVPWMGSF